MCKYRAKLIKMFLKLLIFLNFVYKIDGIIAPPLTIRNSIEEEYGLECIKDVIDSSFESEFEFVTATYTKNLSVIAGNIESNVVEWLNKRVNWSLEVIGERNDIDMAAYVTVPEDLPVINKNNKYTYCGYYVIVTDTISNFEDKANQLFQTKSYYSKAKFLIYVSYLGEDFQYMAEKMLRYLWIHQIQKAVLIIPQNNYFLYSIFTLYAIDANGQCMRKTEMHELDQCKYGSRENNVRLFRSKLRKDKKNCTIEICAIDSPPFVIDVESDDGFEIKLLNLIGKKLNLSFHYTLFNKSDYYLNRNNLSFWEGAQKFMKENYAVGIGNMIANGDIYEDFDVTSPYTYEYLRWITPKANLAPKWKCLFVIFDSRLWLACLTVLLVNSTLFYLLNLFKSEILFDSINRSFLSCLQLILCCSVFKQPTTNVVRMLFLVTVIYGIIVSSLYQSALIDVLTNPLFERQISNQKQILASGINFGGTPEYKKIFKTYRAVFDKFKTNTSFADRNIYDWLVRVAKNKDYCTVSNLFYVNYVQSSKDTSITNAKGYNQLFITKDNLMSYPLHMLTARSFPFLEQFNRIIFQSFTGGLTVHWMNEIKHLINLHTKTPPLRGEDDDVNLTIEHLQGAFLVLFVGLGLSFLCFLCEIAIDKYSKSAYWKKMREKLKNKYLRDKKEVRKEGKKEDRKGHVTLSEWLNDNKGENMWMSEEIDEGKNDHVTLSEWLKDNKGKNMWMNEKNYKKGDREVFKKDVSPPPEYFFVKNN